MVNRLVLTIAALMVLVTAGLNVYSMIATPPTSPTIEASGLALPSAQTSNDTGISVSGQGRVRIKPNLATTSIGVETAAATLAEATSQSNAKMTAIIDKIKGLGVAEKDIQTTAYNVTPVTNVSRQGEPPRITGYRVLNQLSITIRKIDDVGKILDAAVAAGANNVYGISFGVDDPTPYQQQARAAAVKDAQDKATQLAKAAGITLGKVISITEGGVTPVPVLRGAVMTAEAASVPIEAGEMEIVISVNMRFGVQ
jgi:uncharacterized protein YggE